jgi:hypothetical protein
MVCVGTVAPRFDCRAVIRGDLRRLRWRQLQANKTLVLLFNARPGALWPAAELRTLNHATRRLRHLGARMAVVSQAPLSEILICPLLLDPDGYLAWLYDLALGNGRLLCGQFLIDAAGIVRQTAVSCFPMPIDVEELSGAVAAIAQSDQWLRLPTDRTE